MSLTAAESKALLSIAPALEALTVLLTAHARVVKRGVRRQARAQQRWFTAEEVAREMRFAHRSIVWSMPEVMEEAIFPTGSKSPRWTLEGLARAASKMANRTTKAVRNAA